MRKFKPGDICIATGKQLSEDHVEINIGEIVRIEEEYDYMRDCYYVTGENRSFTTMMIGSNLRLKSEYDMLQNQNKKKLNRIPFDMERAKKGDKIINGNGDPVRILTFDIISHNDQCPIVALHARDNYETLLAHRKDGSAVNYDAVNDCLFIASVEKTGWIGLFKINTAYSHGEYSTESTNVYDDELSLLDHIQINCKGFKLICTKQITWTE